MELSPTYTNSWREGPKRIKPGSFWQGKRQWDKRQRAQSVTWFRTGGSPRTSANTSSLCRWGTTGICCPEVVESPQRFSEAAYTWSWATCAMCPCLKRGLTVSRGPCQPWPVWYSGIPMKKTEGKEIRRSKKERRERWSRRRGGGGGRRERNKERRTRNKGGQKGRKVVKWEKGSYLQNHDYLLLASFSVITSCQYHLLNTAEVNFIQGLKTNTAAFPECGKKQSKMTAINKLKYHGCHLRCKQPLCLPVTRMKAKNVWQKSAIS